MEDRAEISYRRSRGAALDRWWSEMTAGRILAREGALGAVAWSSRAEARNGKEVTFAAPTGTLTAVLPPAGNRSWPVGIIAVEGLSPQLGRVAGDAKVGARLSLQPADDSGLPAWS